MLSDADIHGWSLHHLRISGIWDLYACYFTLHHLLKPTNTCWPLRVARPQQLICNHNTSMLSPILIRSRNINNVLRVHSREEGISDLDWTQIQVASVTFGSQIFTMRLVDSHTAPTLLASATSLSALSGEQQWCAHQCQLICKHAAVADYEQVMFVVRRTIFLHQLFYMNS